MKLPRWLMIGMWTSSVLAVLAAAGWWWVTWPERTARAFLELVLANKLRQARELVAVDVPSSKVSASSIALPSALDRAVSSDLRLEPDSRSFVDVFYCRRHFRMPRLDFEFTVERGKLVEETFSGWVYIYAATDQQPYSYTVESGWSPSEMRKGR